VMGGHGKVRQAELLWLLGSRQHGEFATDAVRAKSMQEVELLLARGFGLRIGEIDDRSLPWAGDGCVWGVEEALKSFREPMIAPRLLACTVHALLHHDPATIIAHDEGMQI